MGSTQALYKRFTNLSFFKDGFIFDFNDIDIQGVKGLDATLYISVSNVLTLNADETLNLSPYEIHEKYTTYKVIRRKPFASSSIFYIN
jgi:hypothetical protein